MRNVLSPILALLVGIAGQSVVSAHHSFAAEFDDTKPLKITGTLMKVEWANPHIWYYVDVKNADGKNVFTANAQDQQSAPAK